MPKISGTRKELAQELKDRLTRGPSFSASPSSSDPAFSPEEAVKQYKIWAESWILEPLCKLIPELKGTAPSEMASEAKRCSQCKTKKPDVKFRMDPYEQDVNGKKKYRNLCDVCESKISDEI